MRLKFCLVSFSFRLVSFLYSFLFGYFRSFSFLFVSVCFKFFFFSLNDPVRQIATCPFNQTRQKRKQTKKCFKTKRGKNKNKMYLFILNPELKYANNYTRTVKPHKSDIYILLISKYLQNKYDLRASDF